MHLFSSLSLLSFALPLVSALDATQMTAHLAAAAPLLGTFEASTGNLTSWMSTLDDTTSIQSMSIPGTHDTLTCEYPFYETGLPLYTFGLPRIRFIFDIL